LYGVITSRQSVAAFFLEEIVWECPTAASSTKNRITAFAHLAPSQKNTIAIYWSVCWHLDLLIYQPSLLFRASSIDTEPEPQYEVLPGSRSHTADICSIPLRIFASASRLREVWACKLRPPRPLPSLRSSSSELKRRNKRIVNRSGTFGLSPGGH
jgi:hypothetical protein